MIKKIKTLLFIFIILFSVPAFTYALQHGVSIGGNNNVGSACSGSGSYPWCFNRHGIRISLYKYQSRVLTNYGSVDFETNYSNIHNRENLTGRTAHIAIASSGNLTGKVAYTHFNYGVNWSSGYYVLSLKNNLNGISYKNLDCIASWYGCKNVASSGGLRDDIISGFSLKSGNPNTVVNAINNVFSSVSGANITVSDLQYIYITVEPTMYIYNSSNGETYYGTIYELGKKSFPGVNQEVFYRFPTGIYAAKPTHNDPNNFVGSSGNMVKVLGNYASFITESGLDSGTSLPDNRTHVLSKEGYGIGVFWVGDYVPATCKATCGSGNLKCAENYCEKDSSVNTSAKKKQCIKDCGVTEPSNMSCGSQTCNSNGSNTNCESNSYLINSTSSKCSADRYIMTKCTQKIDKLKYSNDLPDVFDAGVGGFNYNAYLDVSKECTITFNVDAYNFDYAALKSGDRGTGNSTYNAFTNAFNRYTKLSTYSSDSTYKYSSSTDKITLNVDGSPFEMKVSSTNLKDAVLKSNGSQTIHRYNRNSDDSESVFLTRTYSSTGNISYELPKQCYSVKNSSIYKFPCNDSSDLLSYGYYNLKKNSDKPTDVKIFAKLNNGCLNNNHTCYYTIGDKSKDPNCYINAEKINNNIYDLTFNLENPGGRLVSYWFDSTSNSNITSESYIKSTPKRKIVSSETEIVGKIQYLQNGKTVVKQCPAKLKVYSPGTDCVNTFKGQYAKYEAIQSFCAANWKNDVNNYLSEKDCADKCGKPDITKTCKQFKCTDYDVNNKIQDWCKFNYKSVGYNSIEQCNNDCSCSNNEVKDYIYRPIALGGNNLGTSNPLYNAFPNRNSGSNWKGYEDKYTTNDHIFDGDPVYVIELNEDAIKTIKNDTASNGKSVYLYNKNDNINYDNNTQKTYKSDFINRYKAIFTCIDGSGSGC